MEFTIKKSLPEIVQDGERLFGVIITLHDHFPKRRVLGPGRYRHRSPFCLGLKKTGKRLEEKCLQFCLKRTAEELRRNTSPLLKKCHGRVWELVVPVHHHNALSGHLFAGPFLLEEEPAEERIFTQPESRTARGVAELRRTLPTLDKTRLKALSSFLQLLASAIAASIKPSPDRPGSRKEQIEQFIEQSFHKPCSLGDLAGALGLSESRTSQLLAEQCGVSFNELLNQKRIASAKALMRSSGLTLSRIAKEAGFSDPGYFFKVFKKHTGQSAGTWRKEQPDIEV